MLEDVLKTAVEQEPKIEVLLNEENVISAAFAVCDTMQLGTTKNLVDSLLHLLVIYYTCNLSYPAQHSS